MTFDRSMTRFVGQFVLAFVLLATIGCKEPLPDGSSIDPALAGSWTLERDETLRRQRKMYRDAGVLKVNQEVFEFNRNFSTVHFDLDLGDDASFTCSMGDMYNSGEFSGYWTCKDNLVEMVQTHEEDKPKRDRMDGNYDGNLLRMTQYQDEYAIPWVFRRVGSMQRLTDEKVEDVPANDGALDDEETDDPKTEDDQSGDQDLN